jgi:hypothetical protein
VTTLVYTHGLSVPGFECFSGGSFQETTRHVCACVNVCVRCMYVCTMYYVLCSIYVCM